MTVDGAMRVGYVGDGTTTIGATANIEVGELALGTAAGTGTLDMANGASIDIVDALQFGENARFSVTTGAEVRLTGAGSTVDFTAATAANVAGLGNLSLVFDPASGETVTLKAAADLPGEDLDGDDFGANNYVIDELVIGDRTGVSPLRSILNRTMRCTSTGWTST